jgi:hypothetical protein
MFWWWFMPTMQFPIHLPLSGAVTQDIEASLLRQSSAADVERDVLSGVASYGKQIGKLNEAVQALAKASGQDGAPELAAIDAVQREVARIKQRRGLAPAGAEEIGRDLDDLRQRAAGEWEALIAAQASRLPRRAALPAPQADRADRAD